MWSGLLCKVVVAFAVLGVVSGKDPKPSGNKNNAEVKATSPPETTNTPQDQSDDAKDKKDYPPLIQSIIDKFELVKRGGEVTPLESLIIPEDLTGKSDEELVGYTELLKKRRKELQNKILMHLFVTGVLTAIGPGDGATGIAKGVGDTFDWANIKFREAINEEWKVHQRQLANFIVEYARVKQVDLKKLKTIKIQGAGNKAVEFRVWVTEKDRPLPKDSELTSLLSTVKNWLSK